MSQVLAGHIAIIIGIIVLAYAFLVYRSLKALPEGNDKMRDIASAIQEGAMVFLKREYQIILIFVAIVFILLGISINFATAFAYLGGGCYLFCTCRFLRYESSYTCQREDSTRCRIGRTGQST